MEEKQSVIFNHRATVLTAPGAGDHSARALAPGRNKVPADYVEALEAIKGKPGPGKVWKQWRDLRYVSIPATPAEAKAEASKPEGPPPPASVADRKVEAAEAMVAVETDSEVLRGWYASDKRKPVREAISARLKEIGAGS